MPRKVVAPMLPPPSGRICCFCGLGDDNELEYGKFHEYNGITTHYYCLLLSSNMQQKGRDDEGILGFLPEDINKELKRGKRLACCYCKKTGATLGCCNTKCKKIFHFPCGLKAGSLHQFFGEFRSYCKNHRPKQNIDNRVAQEVKMRNDMICYICYDDVSPHDMYGTLWAPCCKKNAWFHRTCVQQLAMSAGYFFKCPLCNNKAEFQRAMLDQGIFIPSQDASWELVPNAFEELLYRHNRCDADDCLCPKGREHTSTNAKWELTLCRTCGSQGIHMACGQLKWVKPIWECSECTSILNKTVMSDSESSSAVRDSRHRRMDRDDDTSIDVESSDSEISVGTETMEASTSDSSPLKNRENESQKPPEEPVALRITRRSIIPIPKSPVNPKIPAPKAPTEDLPPEPKRQRFSDHIVQRNRRESIDSDDDIVVISGPSRAENSAANLGNIPNSRLSNDSRAIEYQSPKKEPQEVKMSEIPLSALQEASTRTQQTFASRSSTEMQKRVVEIDLSESEYTIPETRPTDPIATEIPPLNPVVEPPELNIMITNVTSLAPEAFDSVPEQKIDIKNDSSVPSQIFNDTNGGLTPQTPIVLDDEPLPNHPPENNNLHFPTMGLHDQMKIVRFDSQVDAAGNPTNTVFYGITIPGTNQTLPVFFTTAENSIPGGNPATLGEPQPSAAGNHSSDPAKKPENHQVASTATNRGSEATQNNASSLSLSVPLKAVVNERFPTPRSSRKLADGSRKSGEGSRKSGDGSRRLSDGSRKLSDSSRNLSDGSRNLSDGSKLSSDRNSNDNSGNNGINVNNQGTLSKVHGPAIDNSGKNAINVNNQGTLSKVYGPAIAPKLPVLSAPVVPKKPILQAATFIPNGAPKQPVLPAPVVPKKPILPAPVVAKKPILPAPVAPKKPILQAATFIPNGTLKKMPGLSILPKSPAAPMSNGFGSLSTQKNAVSNAQNSSLPNGVDAATISKMFALLPPEPSPALKANSPLPNGVISSTKSDGGAAVIKPINPTAASKNSNFPNVVTTWLNSHGSVVKFKNDPVNSAGTTNLSKTASSQTQEPADDKQRGAEPPIFQIIRPDQNNDNDDDCDGDAGSAPAVQPASANNPTSIQSRCGSTGPGQWSPTFDVARRDIHDRRLFDTECDDHPDDASDCSSSSDRSNASDRTGLIYKSVNLRDLKFSICASNIVKMTLYDTYTVNMKLDSSNLCKNSKYSSPRRPTNFALAREARLRNIGKCDSNEISNSVESLPSVIGSDNDAVLSQSESTSQDNVPTPDSINHTNDPCIEEASRGQDELKENLDPIPPSTNSPLSATNAVDRKSKLRQRVNHSMRSLSEKDSQQMMSEKNETPKRVASLDSQSLQNHSKVLYNGWKDSAPHQESNAQNVLLDRSAETVTKNAMPRSSVNENTAAENSDPIDAAKRNRTSAIDENLGEIQNFAHLTTTPEPNDCNHTNSNHLVKDAINSKRKWKSSDDVSRSRKFLVNSIIDDRKKDKCGALLSCKVSIDLAKIRADLVVKLNIPKKNVGRKADRRSVPPVAKKINRIDDFYSKSPATLSKSRSFDNLTRDSIEKFRDALRKSKSLEDISSSPSRSCGDNIVENGMRGCKRKRRSFEEHDCVR